MIKSDLEKLHPHIVETVIRLWGTGELDQYFNQLMIIETPEEAGVSAVVFTRKGFSFTAMSELIAIQLLNQAIINQPEPCIWEGAR